jgi:dihydroorotase
MSAIALRGGRIIDPASGIDVIGDLVISGGVVAAVASGSDRRTDVELDVVGLIVSPGWIDAHVHLRDPGQLHKEDLESGAAAALAGGFVQMCCMPNTTPALDTPERIADIVTRAHSIGVKIRPIGAISVGRHGHELAPLREMATAGAIGFSDDGDSTKSPEVMRQALQLSRELNLPIMVHCEDPVLAAGGSMHRGTVSAELGDSGVPAWAEESYIERDIALAEEVGGWLHVLHVSTARGADMVRAAKARGVRVTAEVMPHHLLLTDEWVAGRRRYAGEAALLTDAGRVDTNAKVNPPLRPEADALALIQAVRDGVFDFIATDHAPHSEAEKPAELAGAAFGMLGLELAVPTLARLVQRGDFDWPLVIDLLTRKPAEVLGLSGGSLAVGAAADVTVIDHRREWVVSAQSIRSRSKNTPFMGMTVQGKAVLTMVGGEVRHNELS